MTAGLNGLNWQVQVDPLSLSTTSLPDTVPVLTAFDEVDALLDELDDELPPQAVAIMHSAANAMSHLKRFIDTLRSYDPVIAISPSRVRLGQGSI